MSQAQVKMYQSPQKMEQPLHWNHKSIENTDVEIGTSSKFQFSNYQQAQGIKFQIGPQSINTNIQQQAPITNNAGSTAFKKGRDTQSDELVKLSSQSAYDYVKTHFPAMNDAEVRKIIEEENSCSQDSQKSMMEVGNSKIDKKLTQYVLNEQVKKFGNNSLKSYQQKYGQFDEPKNKTLQNKVSKKRRNAHMTEVDDSEQSNQQILLSHNNQMETQNEQSQPLIQQQQPKLTPEDQFFVTLEQNLPRLTSQQDRNGAYQFVIEQLHNFIQKAPDTEKIQLKEYVRVQEAQSKVLKKGIQIQNRKLNENAQKVQNYDGLMACFQKLQHESNLLRNQNHYLLSNLIPDPHLNDNFGGNTDHNGGGGIC